MNILLKSVKIVNAATKDLHLKTRDIFIENGVIKKIATSIKATPDTKMIAYPNAHVSLGWLDTGVSFGEPGYEERETITNGLQCAAKSGFTDIVLNPTGTPKADSSAPIVFLKNAAERHLTRLHPLGNLTMNGEGVALAELYDMTTSGAVGFYDHKKTIANPNLLKIALQYAQNFDALVYSFPLEKQIASKGIVNEGAVSTSLGLKGIPAFAEELQIARDIAILEYTGGKLHIPTISTAGSVKLIAEAKKKGLAITCSVAIHNLCYTDEKLEDFDTNYKVMPPLRTQTDINALIIGVKEGTVDFVTSDHSPLNIELKQVEFDHAAYGTIGLESAFGSLLQLFGLEKTIDLLTKGYNTWGLEAHKLTEGAAACFTIFNPEAEATFTKNQIHSTSSNSMFLGASLKGEVLGCIANNQYILNN